MLVRTAGSVQRFFLNFIRVRVRGLGIVYLHVADS